MKNIDEEKLHVHLCDYLQTQHGYIPLSAADMTDSAYHFVAQHLFSFLEATQSTSLATLRRDYYGTNTEKQILKEIQESVKYQPLWLTIRNGITIKGIKLYLYQPRPRSRHSTAQARDFAENRFAYKKEFYFSPDNKEAIDLVLYLNGLPIITVELKHAGATGEGNSYVDAIGQYVNRRQSLSRIFTLPFAHFAADTDTVKVATDLSRADNFQFFNKDLHNTPDNEGEYPIEHLYAQVFSRDYITDFIEYFLIYVTTKEDKSAFTIFPRYHQLRSTRNLATDLQAYVEDKESLGKKYLINHSPGSGKTLTISWMAERLDSLFDTVRNEKIIDIVFVLTDRKSLDTNVKDDLEKFTHLRDKVVFTDRAEDVRKAVEKRTNIVVTTIQKFNYIQEKLKQDERFKDLKIAFLIDEAHRSQNGKMGKNVRTTFSDLREDETDTLEDSIATFFKKINIDRQVYIAFTATPTEKTVNLFGQPFDTYSEEEAIEEGYILDVTESIISYNTLYNLTTYNGKFGEHLFPKMVIANLLRGIAFEDKEIIQYKSAIIINHFEKEIANMLDGKAKVMVVTSSRQAGYYYYQTIKGILENKQSPHKVLYAFTAFLEKETKKEVIEASVNGIEISDETPIEKYFEQNDYRFLVVANKFQQGFDEPLLCAMYLDKIVKGVNAVQTVSRLNRKAKDKNSTVLLDFTNNTKEIFKAFSKYRKGAKVRTEEPKPEELAALYTAIHSKGIFTKNLISEYIQKAKEGRDAEFQVMTVVFRRNFENLIHGKEQRKAFVNDLWRYVRKYNFLSQFVTVPKHLEEFALFADLIAGKLIKIGNDKTLKEALKDITVEKAAVKYLGVIENPHELHDPKGGITATGESSSPPKATIKETIADIKVKFNISDDDEIMIKAVFEERLKDDELIELITANKNDKEFLQKTVATELRNRIIESYKKRGQIKKTREELYKEPGGIFDLLVSSVIQSAIALA